MAAEPQFLLPPDGRRRFALLHRPQCRPRGSLLHVHALAEEMNKSRRMVAEQARQLAAAGWAVLQWDLLGCGDSEGDFSDADWAGWCDELRWAAGWLQAQAPGPQWLWGLRAGALLAAEAARGMDTPPNLLLWQPMASGKLAAQQFLRLKMAAQLLGGQAKGVMQATRAELAAGATVSIAGYPLRAALLDGLEGAQLAPVAGVTQLVWLELGEGEEPSPLALRALDAWRAAGTAVAHAQRPGPAFWQTTEIEQAPALWSATLASLEATHGAA